MRMIRGRKPAADDKWILRLIRRELIPLTPIHLRPVWPDATLKRRLERCAVYVWLPDEAHDPRACGFIAAFARGGELFVDMLAVDRSYQGHGVGGMLLRKAEAYGAALGCAVMRLYVNETNRRGIRFYRKHGMTAAWYDARLESYVMEKRIG